MKRVSLATEAAKGVREYKPSKTFAVGGNLSKEESSAWDKNYRNMLIERLKQFKPIEIKATGQGLGEMIIIFNNNLDKPEWYVNEEALKAFPIWSLRDIVVLLENKKEIKK